MNNLGGNVRLTSCPKPGGERGENVLVTAFLQASLSSVTWGDLRERETRPQLPNELHISDPGGQYYLSPPPHPVPVGASEEYVFDKVTYVGR